MEQWTRESRQRYYGLLMKLQAVTSDDAPRQLAITNHSRPLSPGRRSVRHVEHAWTLKETVCGDA